LAKSGACDACCILCAVIHVYKLASLAAVVYAGSGLLPHAYFRWCKLQAAAVGVAGKAMQSHIEEPMRFWLKDTMMHLPFAAADSMCPVNNFLLTNTLSLHYNCMHGT